MEESVFYSVISGSREPDDHRRATVRRSPAVLHHYSRRRVKGAPFPAIVAEPNSKVKGIYVSGLTESDMRLLDMFEGEFMYDRVGVRVKMLRDNRETEETFTETYVWKDGTDGLEAGDWDFKEFRKNKLAAFIGDASASDDIPDDGFELADRGRLSFARRPSSSSRRTPSRGRQGRLSGIRGFPRAQSLQVCNSSSPSRSSTSKSTSLSGRKRGNPSEENIVERTDSVTSRFPPAKPRRLRSAPLGANGASTDEALEKTTRALSKYSMA